jgi:L-alanine-DL-glutamate epimerase-like enolase superfamily enzyme
MQPESLEAIPYSLPFREPYVTARGELSERALVLLRVRAEGLEGLGEAAALTLRGGAGVGEIARQLEQVCRPVLLEGGFDPGRIWSSLARCRSRGASSPALAALDIALHDLAAKAEDKPLWRLLGARGAKPVLCNATLPALNPAPLRVLAQLWHERGFRTFKLKVGLAGDVAQVASVREVLGPGVKLRVDANGAWTRHDAGDRLRALAQHSIELAEEAVTGLEQMARLRAERTGIPLAADESLVSVRDAREAVRLRACSYAAVKLAKVGGISAALEVARELPSYLSSALEGPVGIAAAAHTVQALPERPETDALAHGLATEQLFSETIGSGAVADGDRLLLGDTPGLGVEIDERALAARRI